VQTVPHIASLFLANHAEVREGLLYVQGGGWNQHTLSRQPDGTVALAHFGIVVGIGFEPGDDATQTNVSIRIVSETGDKILDAEGQVGVQGASPVTRLAIVALNTEVRWQHTGIYQLKASLSPNQDRVFTFSVLDRQPPA